MFDIGFFELFVVGVIALAVLGPEQMMTAAKTVGRYIGRARQQVHHIGQQIEQHEALTGMQEVRSMVEHGIEKVEQSKEDVTKEVHALQGNFSEYVSDGQKIPDSLRGVSFADVQHQDTKTQDMQEQDVKEDVQVSSATQAASEQLADIPTAMTHKQADWQRSL